MTARLFSLHRDRDVTGYSGEGVVADGVEFDDDTVVLHWRGARRSTVVYAAPDGMAALLEVNGHDGATRVVWADDDPGAAYPAG